MPYANNKGTDQPAHPHSLISSFAVRCLDSIIYLVSILTISWLTSFWSWAGQFESYPVKNPEDRFSHDVAHIYLLIKVDIQFLVSITDISVVLFVWGMGTL